MTDNTPIGWEVRELEPFFGEVIMGQSPPGDTYNSNREGLPFFQGKKDFGVLYPEPTSWCTDPRKISKKGDVLISVRAPVGPTNLTPFECAIGRGLAAIRPNSSVKTRFLLYQLRAIESKIARGGRGSTFNSINKTDIQSLRLLIPYPNDSEKSLQEQRRIVARIESLLDEVQQAEKLHGSIVKDTEQLMDAVLGEVFSEDNSTIKMRRMKLSNLAVDTIRKNPKREFPNKNFYYVDISSVDKEKCQIVSPKEMLGSDSPSRARKVIHKGDVIFATTRPELKTIALIPESLDEQICSTGFCVLRHKNHIIPEYIYFQLRSPFFINQIIKKQHGASYPAVNDSEVFDTDVLLPEKDGEKLIVLQKEVVEKFKQVAQYMDSLRESQREIESQLDDLQQSILSQAFKGEL